MIHTLTLPTPFAVGDVHSYLLKGDSLTLFDVGPKTDQARQVLEQKLKELNVAPSDIEQVVLTHHHPDHSGWTELFENATLLGHAYNDVWFTRDQDFFAYHDAFYLEQLQEEGVPEEYYHWIEKMKRPIQLMGNRPLDAVLEEGDKLPGHPELVVLETLGHAQSQLSFYNEQANWMIGGDHVIAHISSNPLIEPPLKKSQGRPKALLQYNASLRRMLDFTIEKIYSGHGEVVQDVHPLIEYRLQRQHQRALHMLTLLGDETLTIFELTKRLFPKVYEKELGLTLSETIGQIDYLMDNALLVEELHEGVKYYRKA